MTTRELLASAGPKMIAVVGCALAIACSSEVSINILPGCQDEASCRRTSALSFAGPYDRVEIANSPLLDVPQDFAIEAWVFVDSYAGGHGVVNRWEALKADLQLTFGSPEILPDMQLAGDQPLPSHTLATWGFYLPLNWVSAYSITLPKAGEWHHLASSYGAGSLKLYVDGARWATANATDRIANANNKLYIGATARSQAPIDPQRGEQWWPPMHGSIAEVRISRVDRYTTPFVPERRLAADGSTIALWHLDEGNGTMALDSGPSRLHGTIVNAKWTERPPR